jgi:hypothetical protein
MIHYQLQCDEDHRFDGWFQDSGAFDRQAKTGFVICPICNSAAVTRAVMAPALGRGTKRRERIEAAPVAITAPVPVSPPTSVIAENGMPDAVRALLQRLRAEVERNCDYVGPSFAAEVRKIHKGEIAQRGIYGETTPSEAEALADEGIEVGVLPWLPRSDS